MEKPPEQGEVVRNFILAHAARWEADEAYDVSVTVWEAISIGIL